MDYEENAPECYNGETRGEDYRGKQNEVYSENQPVEKCKNWQNHPDKRYKSISGNYCRNPGGLLSDNQNEPWCFTDISRNKKEACKISTCLPVKVQKGGIIEMKNKGGEESWKPVCPTSIGNVPDLMCKGFGYEMAKNIGNKKYQFVPSEKIKGHYYEYDDIITFDKQNAKYWPGHSKDIYTPPNSGWCINTRLSVTPSPTSTWSGNIEFKLYGIATDPNNTTNFIAYTEDINDYNYWRNLKDPDTGKLRYKGLKWGYSDWYQISTKKR